VVDDEPDVLTYLTTALEDEDFVVRGFSGAEGLLDEAVKDPPDLICLDIMMPNRSGLSLYKDLKSRSTLARIPIVIVSGYSRVEEFHEEFDRLVGVEGVEGSVVYVEKPVHLEEFLELVRGLLSERPS
jgi:DNA-binding response OmpR family regulator